MTLVLVHRSAWVASADGIVRKNVQAGWCVGHAQSEFSLSFHPAKWKTTGLQPPESLASPYENVKLLTLTSNWYTLTRDCNYRINSYQ